jgi:hypothetical protein
MRKVLFRTAAVVAAGAVLGGCWGGVSHPDPARYEYMYINGVFQPPYSRFPTGTERADWKCYDGKTSKEYDCTFVRGGWDYYQYIYRARK